MGIDIGQYQGFMVRYSSSNLANLCTSKASVRGPIESRDTFFDVFAERPKKGGGAKTIGANNRLSK
jgi:hypothetical protein